MTHGAALVLLLFLSLVGIVGLVAGVAWVAARSCTQAARSARQPAEPGAGAATLAVFREFLLAEYVERPFKASPEAPTIDGKTVRLLREARTKALQHYAQNPQAWEKASRVSNQGTWQNRVAFEMAYALQNLGTAAITGMIPLRLILAVVGDVVVDDWLLCRSWVKSYRTDQQSVLLAPGPGAATVHYHRRHAEWLALVALVWMARHWSYAHCEPLVQGYGGMQGVSTRLQALCRADALLMPTSVRQDVRTLTGVGV